MGTRTIAAGIVVILLGTGPDATAQDRTGPLYPVTVELTAGVGAFADETPIRHDVFGVGLRVPVSPRLSLGPEMTYMRGPGDDRDLFLTGNLTFDIIDGKGGARRLVPFLVAGGGLMRYSNRLGASRFSGYEGAATGGGGVRIAITNRVHAAAEARIGWEPHVRYTGAIGIALQGR